jgi:hypothetical protein
MLALSLIATTLLLLMTRYRVWVYAALSGVLFALVFMVINGIFDGCFANRMAWT